MRLCEGRGSCGRANAAETTRDVVVLARWVAGRGRGGWDQGHG